jgi:hypothetical protein
MEFAIYLEVEPEFQSVKRKGYVKRHFDYEAHNEPIMTSEKKYEIKFFNMLLDTALMSIKESFEQLHQHTETLCFLYKINELPKKEKLIKYCADLQLALTIGLDADIKGASLCDKLLSIKKLMKNLKNPMPLNISNFIRKLNTEDLYPNIWVSLRILLTMPVSTASGKRSFSKLKLIKIYLRSSMS